MKHGWRWTGALLLAGALGWTGCGGDDKDTTRVEVPVTPVDEDPRLPDAGTGEVDAGTQVPDAGTGTTDAGTGTVDAGTGTTDAGTGTDAGTDAGTTDPGETTYTPPSIPGWTFYGREQGGPRFVYGVTADEGGNVWVAGGEEGLFLLKKGESTFRKFTMADGLRPYGYMPDGSAPPGTPYLKVISVAGAWDGAVFVGYAGKPPPPGIADCESEWDTARHAGRPADASVYKSGDADRVELRADGTLKVVHYDISSGPKVVKDEPPGREKLCTVWRIAYDPQPTREDPHNGHVWFGANHGFARGDASFQGNPTCNGQLACSGVQEHSHPAFNASIYVNPTRDRAQYGTDYSKYEVRGALLTDAYWGLAPLPNHDVWVGGANRSTKYYYGSNGNDFWTAQEMTERSEYTWNRRDIWPDKVGEQDWPYSRPEERTDDLVSGMALVPDGTNRVWVSSFANGLVQLDSDGNVVRSLKNDLIAPHVSSVAVDPLDNSAWAGAAWGGGISRVGGGVTKYSYSLFGQQLSGMRIPDIQVDNSGARRRMLVAFTPIEPVKGPVTPGAIGIYDGD
ncbi:hypothetical protein D7X96_11320 [Corallococcus interemptor]|uniref:Uncharacterized protein n=1 Tax=Corallococcus interemptor TaxID=2316720 RepID=A0A3A8QS10_9BACT|nr:hypothetical protein [Corallococcus interemptor]RKH70611.1 hypothetical protein D7X96_11320 [Corallococcus interemptor]